MIEKEKIIQWLEEEGLAPELQENTSGRVEWTVKAHIQNIPFIAVLFEGEDVIHLQRLMEIDDEVQETLGSTSIAERENLLYQLKRGFLLSHVRYRMKFKDDENTILSNLNLEYRIYEDGLTKEQFFCKLFALHDASLLLTTEVHHLRSTPE